MPPAPTTSVRRAAVTAATALLLAAGAGCAGPTADVTPETFAAYATPLTKLRLPAAVDRSPVVAMGEATHGNAELVGAKQRVFAELVERHGHRVFALEADAGGAAAVDAYVRTGRGSAAAAVDRIGFPIYRTVELTQQVEWIRAFNDRRPAADQIRVHGFDFQRYDLNKAGLDAFLREIDPSRAADVRAALAGLTDTGFRDLDAAQQEAGAREARTVLDAMVAARDRYVPASSREAYEQALQFARVVWQGARWRADGADATVRDGFMADNVAWILAVERAERSRAAIFVSGHNGHVSQVSPPTYTAMGALLADRIGEDAYYVVGTEFRESRFTVATRDSRETHEVTNSQAKEWTRLFGAEQPGFVDFAAASADPQLAAFLQIERRMSNVGNEFRPALQHLPQAYTIAMRPAEAYDALVFVDRATPTTLLP